MIMIIIVLLLYIAGIAAISPLEVVTVVGEVAILPCQNIPGNTRVQWLRRNSKSNSTFITYTDGWNINTNLLFYERLHIVGDKSNTDYSLEILNTTVDDEGQYSCVVDGWDKTSYFDIILRVRDIFDSTTTPAINITVVAGGNVTGSQVISILLIMIGGIVMIVGVLTFTLVRQTKGASTNTDQASVRLSVQNDEFVEDAQLNEPHYEIVPDAPSNDMLEVGNSTSNSLLPRNIRTTEERTERADRTVNNYHTGPARTNNMGILTEEETSQYYQLLTEQQRNESHTYDECNKYRRDLDSQAATSSTVSNAYEDSEGQSHNVYQHLRQERTASIHIYE